MRYIKSFEALKPSQFRKYVKAFDRERYLDIFKKMGEVYDHDRNFYRVYIPLEKSEVKDEFVSDVHKRIDTFLRDNDCQVVDYVKGTAKFNSAKNETTIGKVLSRLKNEELAKEFVSDEKRKTFMTDRSNDLMVVISRHPYDIAGSDTDRNWTNCMTIGTDKSNRILNMIDQLSKMSKGDPGYKRLKSRIDDYREDGANVRYLIKEVTEGSLISYIIKSEDRDIKNPLGVLNIKPYVKDGKDSDVTKTLLMPSRKMYGTQVPNFRKTVMDVLNEFFNGREYGVYNMKNGVYDDDDYSTYVNKPNFKTPVPLSFVEICDEYIDSLNDKYGDLDRVETNEFIYYVDKDRMPILYYTNPKNKNKDVLKRHCWINKNIWDMFYNSGPFVDRGNGTGGTDKLRKMLKRWIRERYHLLDIVSVGLSMNMDIWNKPV